MVNAVYKFILSFISDDCDWFASWIRLLKFGSEYKKHQETTLIIYIPILAIFSLHLGSSILFKFFNWGFYVAIIISTFSHIIRFKLTNWLTITTHKQHELILFFAKLENRLGSYFSSVLLSLHVIYPYSSISF